MAPIAAVAANVEGCTRMVRTAIFDPDIIAEWERRTARYRQSVRRALVVSIPLVLVAALPPILGLVKAFPYLGLAAFASVCAAAIGQAILGVTLMCPHCGQSPVLGGQGAALWEIDHCAKCYYWLRNPRRGRLPVDASRDRGADR